MSPQFKKRVVRGRVSSNFFGVTHLNFYITVHGDSIHCFDFFGENDVCDTAPFMAARLPLVLTSVTPSLRRNK